MFSDYSRKEVRTRDLLTVVVVILLCTEPEQPIAHDFSWFCFDVEVLLSIGRGHRTYHTRAVIQVSVHTWFSNNFYRPSSFNVTGKF